MSRFAKRENKENKEHMENTIPYPLTTVKVEAVTASKQLPILEQSQLEGGKTQTTWIKKHVVSPEMDDEAGLPINDQTDSITPEKDVEKIEPIVTEQSDAPLSDSEMEDLDKLTTIVRQSFDGARIGERALREIRDRRLWRGRYPSFSDFCRSELDLSEARVSQLIQCADEVANLVGKVSDDLIPTSERAIRELRRVKQKNKVAVLLLASELARGGRPTSITIEEARRQIEDGNARSGADRSSDGGVKAVVALKAAKIVKQFLNECDLNKLRLGDITEFRTLMDCISKDAKEKLVISCN